MIRPFRGVHPCMGTGVFVAPTAMVLGDVSLGEDSSVWFGCVLRGDVNQIRVGARCNVQDMSCLHVAAGTHPLELEDEVSIAHNVMLHGCTICRGSLVGMSSAVMDGARVGEGCLVAAGSLLREGFVAPPHTLVAGWPAVVKGALSEKQRHLVAQVWKSYVRCKEDYLREGWSSQAQGGV